MNEKRKFFTLVFLSIIFWWIFEFFNLRIKNWYYVNLAEPEWLTLSIAFSLVWPAIFESFYLLKSLHLFDKLKIRKRKITKKTLITMNCIGVVMLLLVFLKPRYFFL
jgi:tryptophan-rich sensory protein